MSVVDKAEETHNSCIAVRHNNPPRARQGEREEHRTAADNRPNQHFQEGLFGLGKPFGDKRRRKGQERRVDYVEEEGIHRANVKL